MHLGGSTARQAGRDPALTPRRDTVPHALENGYLSLIIYNMNMPAKEKRLEWLGSSYKDLIAFPADVQRSFGYALSLAQAGDKADAAKVLRGFGGAGVLEVVENNVGGTYRAVYRVKFTEAVFVLHCFQKKSKRGIATPTADMDIIRAGLKIAELTAKELRNEKANG